MRENMDYYNDLGVSETATQEEIKKAWKELSFVFHPDRNGGSTKRQAKINDAYSIIGDPEKRKLYDSGEFVPHGPSQQEKAELAVCELFKISIEAGNIDSMFRKSLETAEKSESKMGFQLSRLEGRREELEDKITVLNWDLARKKSSSANSKLLEKSFVAIIKEVEDKIANLGIEPLESAIKINESVIKILKEDYPPEPIIPLISFNYTHKPSVFERFPLDGEAD